MNERDPVGATLEALVPPFDHVPAEWDDVLRRAATGWSRLLHPGASRARARWRSPRWPYWRQSLSSRSWIRSPKTMPACSTRRWRLPLGDGPVLHVVTRSGRGGTLVDLDSGSRSEIRIEQDAWFDPARGFRSTIRFGGSVLGEYGCGWASR